MDTQVSWKVRVISPISDRHTGLPPCNSSVLIYHPVKRFCGACSPAKQTLYSQVGESEGSLVVVSCMLGLAEGPYNKTILKMNGGNLRFEGAFVGSSAVGDEEGSLAVGAGDGLLDGVSKVGEAEGPGLGLLETGEPEGVILGR